MSQTVLITGASGAIGSAIAKSFALEGFHEEELELDDFVNDEH